MLDRKLDELGRVVIPSEIRRNLNIKPGDRLEVIPHQDGITFKVNGHRPNVSGFSRYQKCIIKESLLKYRSIVNLDESTDQEISKLLILFSV